MSAFHANPPPVSNPVAEDSAAAPQRVTLRGLAVALVMVVLMVGMTQAMTIRAQAADVGGSSPPVAPTYLLFLWTAASGVGPAVGRGLRARFRLSRADLILGYCAAMISGPVAHEYSIGFLIPHMVAPYYFDLGTAAFHRWLPAWLGPRDPAVIRAFFLGSGGRVPWGAWLIPGLAWMFFLGALFLTGHCAMILLRRQWVESERLTFPLAQIPLALTSRSGARSESPYRAPLFWIGMLVPLSLGLTHGIHRYAPTFPDLPLRPAIQIDFAAAGTPWKGLGLLELHLQPWLVAIVALLPAEIAFSGWLFFWVTKLEDLSAVAFGATDVPSVYSNQYPALYAQGAGAAYALAALALWGARRHLARVLRAAVSGATDRDEFAPPRAAVLGLTAGIAVMMGWLWIAGMRIWVAALLILLMLGYFVIFARIRGEAGLSMGVILWPKMLDEVVITLVGARALLPADLTILHAVRWVYFGPSIGGVVACQLESFKISGDAGLRSRAVGNLLLGMALLTLPLAFAWTLKTYHQRGFVAMPIGNIGRSMVGSQIYWSYRNLVNTMDNPTRADWSGIGAMGTGAAVTAALAALRTRFLWWPLHPIGDMIANSWGMHLNWGSFTLGWLVKVSLLRWGGLRVFRRAVPFFIGMVVGDMLSEGLWGAFAAWVALAPQ